MRNSSIKLAVASVLLATAGAASALSLNTSGLEANAIQTFSVAAFGSSTAAGISFRPLGNMTKIGDVVVVDEFGVEDLVPQFKLPITKANVSIGWDLKVKTESGNSTRSALQLIRGTRNVVLANFVVDFNAHLINVDYLINGVKTTGSLYSFVELEPETISLKGLVLNMKGKLGKMILTEGAQNTIGDALALSAPLRATLVNQEWGTLDLKVTSYKRVGGKVSDQPFTVADIPAAP